MVFSKLISMITQNTPGFRRYMENNPNSSEMSKLLKVKKTENSGFNHYTFTLRVPKNQFEDDVYSQHPKLLDLIPRAFTIITRGTGSDEIIVTIISGPRKFSGKTAADEDPDGENYKDHKIYDHNMIIKWAEEGNLEIEATEKANGKFALVKIWQFEDINYVTFGSKNNHITIPLESLEEWVSDPKNNSFENHLIYAIGKSIHQDIKSMIDFLMPAFNRGYTLCGELCDGCHFVLGYGQIEWFGFFRFGECLSIYSEELVSISKTSLIVVERNIVFRKGDPVENINDIIKQSRCKISEGSVLYMKNIETGEIILCKTKSVRYILMRMLRQAIINNGYNGIEKFLQRVIDAREYHNLNTDAAIRIAKQLIIFVFWLMENKIPTIALGISADESIRGKIPIGFANWWNEFINTTSQYDIIIMPNDFGDFNVNLFEQEMNIFMNTGNRENCDNCIVIFMQDLQGNGKSLAASKLPECISSGHTENTGACQSRFPKTKGDNFGDNQVLPINTLSKCEMIYVEQDQFYGHSPSCQSWINFMIKYKGRSVIIVSRCNANDKHYKKYIEICRKHISSLIYFIAPERVDEVSVVTGIFGIFERSKSDEKLLLGHQEYDVNKVIEIITGTLKDFKIHEKAIRYEKYTTIPPNIVDEIKAIVHSRDPTKIIQYVKSNEEMIKKLRLPITDIVSNISRIIEGIRGGRYNENIIYNTRPNFVGLCLLPKYNIEIQTSYKGTHYNHHVTQFYHGAGKKWKPSPFETVPHGTIVSAKITHLVIQNKTGAAAYRVDLQGIECSNTCPHITSFMPHGMKPMDSNKFVSLSDDSVTVIEMEEPMEIKLMSKWF